MKMSEVKVKFPVPKRSLVSSPNVKLPIPINDVSCNAQEFVKNLFGKFNGFNVIVDDEKEMDLLYNMGCFGKGSLSRGYPCFAKKNATKCNKDKVERKICEVPTEAEISQQSIVEGDRRKNADLVPETLHLLLEEAFFLCFALDALTVHYKKNEALSLTAMWKLFRNAQSGFVDRYIGYHYFRAKGWVVKAGTKYGGDFLLYKHGPSFYHASYVVMIHRIGKSNSGNNDNGEDLNWNYLLALQRVAETVNKRVVVCEILRPENFDEDDLSQLAHCKVSEFILNRWVASENRIL